MRGARRKRCHKKEKSGEKRDPELCNRIVENDNFFGELIDLIPPEHWGFDEETMQKVKKHKHQSIDRKLTPGQKAKFGNADKQKLVRQDIEQLRTVREIWGWLAATSQIDNQRPKPNKLVGACVTSKKPGDSDTVDVVKSEKVQSKKNKKGHGKKKEETKKAIDSLAPTRTEALHKLQERINELRRKRGVDKSLDEKQTQKKLKRRLSKLKMKEQKGRRKNSENNLAQCEKETKTENKQNQWRSDEISPRKKKPKMEKEAGKSVEKKQEQIVNSEGNVVYSKFDFALSASARVSAEQNGKRNKKMNRNKLTGRDYGRLLNKVQKRQKILKNLEEKDKNKAERFKDNVRWDTAMQRAEGIKVKDNPDLLKKSLKRKQQKKEHSKKKWKQRDDAERKRYEQKQERRKKNIKERIEQKKTKKMRNWKKK